MKPDIDRHTRYPRQSRPLPRVAAVACVLCLTGPVPLAADAETPAMVNVREADGVYTITAQFQVPHPAPVALAVLTDYEQIPRFMPDVKTSIVRERFAGGAIVEQEAVSRVMLFSKRVHLILEVEEQTDAVVFRDGCGRSFSSYEGAWRLRAAADHTVITYELAAKPAFHVPEFLLMRLFKRDAMHMIERLRAEIAARVTRA